MIFSSDKTKGRSKSPDGGLVTNLLKGLIGAIADETKRGGQVRLGSKSTWFRAKKCEGCDS